MPPVPPQASDPPLRPTILVVEDEVPTALATAELLREHDFETVVTHDGAQALERLGAADLVLLDIRLPDRDGFSICREIKQGSAHETEKIGR
ncbi:MAG TPA: response regulator [Longimicrobiaceae bacterium]|jgi:CheY-like chemotaxis protein|nr:response regulator [Longimicrobiaceae bacterium]